jgi:nitrate reductase gamma subunit
MAQVIEFSMGPLSAFSISLMILGLLRLLILTIASMTAAYRSAGDRNIRLLAILKETLVWMLPGKATVNANIAFSAVSFLFHAGLIIVPVFLMEHILVWKRIFQFGWPSIGKTAADVMTLITIAAGLTLLAYRVLSRTRRNLSAAYDYLVLVLILFVFISGYLIPGNSAFVGYESRFLIHTLCGNILLILLPFTKMAHCILFPVVRMASAIAWHFRANAGIELNKLLYGNEKKEI